MNKFFDCVKIKKGKRHVIELFICIIILLFLTASASRAGTISAKNNKAVLRKGPGFQYKVKMPLLEHYPLLVLKKIRKAV